MMKLSRKLPALPFCCSRRIEFSETDAAGIFHFSGFFRLMEFAEAAFFRQLGWPLLAEVEGVTYGFPRIRTNARFISPLEFDDEVVICLEIESMESKRIHYRFRFLRSAKGAKDCVAKGEMSVVHAMKCPRTGTLESAPIPEDLFKLLSQLTNKE